MPTATANRQSPAAEFVVRALVGSLAAFALLRLSWTDAHVILPVTQMQGAWAQSIFGTPAWPVTVTTACSGADAIALCAGAVWAYPVAWRARLSGLAGGLTMLYLDSRVVLAAGAFIAHVTAAILVTAGIGAHAAGHVLVTTRGAFSSAREHDAHWSWRWMGPGGAWIIANTSVRPVAAMLDVEVSAFHRDRRVTLLLNDRPVDTIVVEPERRTYRIGPIRVPPGAHELAFQPVEPATAPEAVMHSGDRRPLSVAIGTWAWTIESDGR